MMRAVTFTASYTLTAVETAADDAWTATATTANDAVTVRGTYQGKPHTFQFAKQGDLHGVCLEGDSDCQTYAQMLADAVLTHRDAHQRVTPELAAFICHEADKYGLSVALFVNQIVVDYFAAGSSRPVLLSRSTKRRVTVESQRTGLAADWVIREALDKSGVTALPNDLDAGHSPRPVPSNDDLTPPNWLTRVAVEWMQSASPMARKAAVKGGDSLRDYAERFVLPTADGLGQALLTECLERIDWEQAAARLVESGISANDAERAVKAAKQGGEK